jgi:hypothetical protein
MNRLLQTTNIHLTERIADFEQQTACVVQQDPTNPVASNPTFNIAATKLAEVLTYEKTFQEHRPTTYHRQRSLMMVIDCLEAYKNFANLGGGGGTTKDDRCIDVTIRHCGTT